MKEIYKLIKTQITFDFSKGEMIQINDIREKERASFYIMWT